MNQDSTVQSPWIGPKALHARYDWLDDARGVVVLMFLCSLITWGINDDALSSERILGSPLLNHGYRYFDGNPPLITLIDVGQQIFMFVMGFVGYFAFTSRLRKRGPRVAAVYAFRRFIVLYACGFLFALNSFVRSQPIDWPDTLYEGTLAKLAFGALAAYIATALIRKADYRFAFAILIMAVQSLLFVFPIFDHGVRSDDVLHLPYFPFEAMNLCALAISGSCFSQWYMLDATDPRIGFQKRIIPVSAATAAAAFSWDWIEPAIHPDSSTALTLMGISGAGFMLAIFYSGGEMGFAIPALRSLGRNLLLMFILGSVFIDIYFRYVPRDFLIANRVLSPFVGFLLPLAPLIALAVILDRKKIYLRA